MVLKVIREVLGRVIIFFDVITRWKKNKRSQEAQAEVDKEALRLKLYQFRLCPFCVRVRRAIHRLNVPIEIRDAQNNEVYREELIKESGNKKVPCLRIEEDGKVKWMKESLDIVKYLEAKFESN